MEKQASESGPHTNPNSVDHLITAFTDITSAATEEAIFFLESHNYDVDAAVSTYYESMADGVNVAPSSVADVAGDRISGSPSPVESSPSASLSPSRSRSPSPVWRSQYNLRSRGQQPGSGSGPASAAGRRVGGIRTLADLNRTDGEGSDSDSDQPQEYYTGGQKSGMLVQDPRGAHNVDNIFDQARQFSTDRPEQISPSSRNFTGTGRLLSGATVSAPQDQPLENMTITHTVTFWQNGFTVNDGPLRMLDDPANASFLESIKNAECPPELEPSNHKTAVHVNLLKKEEKYPEPEKKKNFFQGAGRTLGSATSAPSPSSSTEPFVGAPAILNAAPSPSVGLVVDSNLPTTSIQLRLADGTRMVSRFNLHHTVRDIRAFIDASRRGAGSYNLQTMGFPPKQLTDLDQTIEQAGLASSVVIQRL